MSIEKMFTVLKYFLKEGCRKEESNSGVWYSEKNTSVDFVEGYILAQAFWKAI